MRRITKEERNENARRFYQNFMSGSCNQAAIVAKRNPSTTNPNVNRVQFLAVCGIPMGEPVVIAESATHGMAGCFMEFLDAIGVGSQKTYYEDDFDDWLQDVAHCRISYKDGLVFMLEKEDYK